MTILLIESVNKKEFNKDNMKRKYDLSNKKF